MYCSRVAPSRERGGEALAHSPFNTPPRLRSLIPPLPHSAPLSPPLLQSIEESAELQEIVWLSNIKLITMTIACAAAV
jgi:hypothetical protein